MGQNTTLEKSEKDIPTILNSVITQLFHSNENRTFSFMDIEGFEKWYDDLDHTLKK